MCTKENSILVIDIHSCCNIFSYIIKGGQCHLWRYLCTTLWASNELISLEYLIYSNWSSVMHMLTYWKTNICSVVKHKGMSRWHIWQTVIILIINVWQTIKYPIYDT